MLLLTNWPSISTPASQTLATDTRHSCMTLQEFSLDCSPDANTTCLWPYCFTWTPVNTPAFCPQLWDFLLRPWLFFCLQWPGVTFPPQLQLQQKLQSDPLPAQRLSLCCPICYMCALCEYAPAGFLILRIQDHIVSLLLPETVAWHYTELYVWAISLLTSQPVSACHTSWSTRDFPLLLLILFIMLCSCWVMSLNIITNYSWYPACCSWVLTQPVTRFLHIVTARKQGWEFLNVASYSKTFKCAQIHIPDLQHLSVYCLLYEMFLLLTMLLFLLMLVVYWLFCTWCKVILSEMKGTIK